MVAMIQYPRNPSDILLGKELIKSYIEDIPNYPGIYRMLDLDMRVIYIGKAKNLKNRLKQYTGDLEGKTSIMISLTHYLEYSVTESESSALLLEGQLIKKFKPRFNILLKDDKSFPYIKLRLDHEFPQLLKYRGRELKDGKFFGPFASVKHVEVTLLELQKIFKLRSCSDSYFSSRKRPCLQYQINRCSAPCTGKISKENYTELVDQIKTFLSGKNASLQKLLAQKMQLLSDELEFEEAAKIRDRIKALSYIQLKADGTGLKEDTDLVAITKINSEYCIQLYIYRGGQACGNHPYFPEHTEDQTITEILEAFIIQLYQDKIPPKHIILSCTINDVSIFAKALKELHDVDVKIMLSKKSGTIAKFMQIILENAKIALEQHIKNSAKNIEALAEVQKIFNLPSLPNRIEVYDNSHIQGSFAIGAMIVAGKNGFEKKEYRLFTIKEQPEEVLGGDDYSMLREVLTRKIMKLQSKPHRMPDLMIIDGGKGHMKIVEQVLKKFDLNIPFVCMSKGVDRNSGREQFHRPDCKVFTLDKNLPTMKYLQILRDEVHNFAIKNHRKKRSQAMKISSLDAIPGIGEIRKKSLLSYFGSFVAITDATREELIKVEGINKELSTIIYEEIRK